ncbi:flippase-like domain-containing protein [archaeon]|jgi:glycosyltransferase 2 family protein|nr:flippase-like domain-containing protein [archaeon]MBT3720835.1 flippase-like domain-containing protein [archaeon]MBT4022861.1 flippase-like domain-containing protein [archaeon]MBT4272945.1 flippase-like domain-containing protein [archaeon]MBT4460964.1 flippase-like domain-containing protein [archaeon]
MKKSHKFIVSFLISAILVYFLLKQINLSELYEVLLRVNPILLLGSFILYILLALLRVFRFQVLLKKSLPSKTLFPIICVHTLLKIIIPFRVGDLSIVYMLKKRNHSIGKGMSSLIVARIFDFVIIVFGFIIFTIFSSNLPNRDVFVKLIPYTVFFLLILVFGLIILLISPDLILKILKKIKLEKLGGLITPFNDLKSRHVLFKTFFITLGIYFVSMIYTYILVLGVGFLLPLNIYVIMISISALSAALPINGIAGFGTVEAVIALTLSYFGYAASEAILLGFSTHIIQILFATILGLIGYILLEKTY